MTRTAAREIAVRLAYELGYTNESAEQMLDRFLAPEHFMTLAQEDDLYADYPGQGEEAYIRRLVSSWTVTSRSMPSAGSLSGSPVWRPPLCGSPCMSCCICRIFHDAQSSTPLSALRSTMRTKRLSLLSTAFWASSSAPSCLRRQTTDGRCFGDRHQ